MNIIIIIVSWNVRDLLAGCLRSIQAEQARSSSSLNLSTWVVDNASHDGSAEMVAHDFRDVHLITSPDNLGFAGGNNAALRAIGFPTAPPETLPDAVLLLNPDTELHPHSLSRMALFMHQQTQVGIVGAQLQFGDGTFQHGAFALPGLSQLALDLLPFPTRLYETRLNGRYPRRWYEAGQPFAVGHPLGAAMLVRREAICQVGLLDEAYHMYVEEVEWSQRISQVGWQAYCVPQAVVTHFGGQSTGQVRLESMLNLWTSRQQFYRQYQSRWKFWLAQQIVRFAFWQQSKLAQHAQQHGQLSPHEAQTRIETYRQIVALWTGKK